MNCPEAASTSSSASNDSNAVDPANCLPKNLSYDGNYHRQYYYTCKPRVGKQKKDRLEEVSQTQTQRDRQRVEEATSPTDSNTCTGFGGEEVTCSKLAHGTHAKIAGKMDADASDVTRTTVSSNDAQMSVGSDPEQATLMNSLSDIDFDAHSPDDNSARPSNCTMEDGVSEEVGKGCASETTVQTERSRPRLVNVDSRSKSCPDIKPHIKLLPNSPQSAPDVFAGPEASELLTPAEEIIFEDREFDFLKAEPRKRSSSLKSRKTPPGTPSRKKEVRFADALGLDLESVRHIMNVDRPPVVPSSAMKDLRIGLDEDRKSQGVRYLSACFSQPGADACFLQRVTQGKAALENCIVDDKDMTVSGVVRVSNIAYHKKVMVRYSTNNWVSFDDVHATYVQNSNDGSTDRFTFTITVPHYFTVGNRLEFSIMFAASGVTYWDNNYGSNYAIECYARQMPTNESDNTWMHFL